MKYVVMVVALVLLAYLVVDFNHRSEELNRLRAEEEEVQVQLEGRQATRDALSAQVAYATSESAVYEWAYNNHLAKPGDVVVIPAQVTQATPVPPPPPVIIQEKMSNLDHWLALFFDPIQ